MQPAQQLPKGNMRALYGNVLQQSAICKQLRQLYTTRPLHDAVVTWQHEGRTVTEATHLGGLAPPLGITAACATHHTDCLRLLERHAFCREACGCHSTRGCQDTAA